MTSPRVSVPGVIPPSLEAALRDRFPIERELGQGGMATVYLARDTRLNRQVAIKVMRPDVGVLLGRDRFEQEVRVASSLSHPHIVPVFESGEAAGFLFYVMPCVDGETLSVRLERERHLGLEESVRLLEEVAGALDHAHAHGVVHRDMKPGNILLSGGHALVADFGIALALSKVDSKRMTETGLSMGTPAYMSPEQAAGHRSIDGRSDQYSLACMFYEMLGGDPPFIGSTPRSVMARHIADTPPPLATLRPGLPAGVEQAVRQALSKIPADRFESCGAFAHAVRAGLSGGNVTATATAPRRPWPRLSPRSVMATAFVLIGATAVAIAWGYLPREDAIESIALLPPENRGRDTSQAYRVAGVFDQLTLELVQSRNLRFKPPTATRPHWERGHSIEDVASALGVQAVLETSVAPTSDSVRITLRLIRAETQELVWGRDSSVGWAEVNRLVGALAQGLSEATRAAMPAGSAQRLASARTVDPRAYDLFLKAHYGGSLEQRREWLNQAVQIDPTYADAYAGLAMVYTGFTQYGLGTPADMNPQAIAAADRAVALDSLNPFVRAAKRTVDFWIRWDAAAATREPVGTIQGAELSLGPYLLVGQVDQVLPYFDRAAEDDPLNAVASLNQCWARITGGKPQEALPYCRRTATAYPAEATWAHFETAWAFALLGMADSAMAAMRRTGVAPGTSDDLVWLGPESCVYGLSGKPREARLALDKLLRMAGPTIDPFVIATAYHCVGDDATAMTYLERVYAEHWASAMFLKTEPFLLPRIRSLPRFQQIVRSVFREFA